MKIPKGKVVISLVGWGWVCIMGSFGYKHGAVLFLHCPNFPPCSSSNSNCGYYTVDPSTPSHSSSLFGNMGRG